MKVPSVLILCLFVFLAQRGFSEGNENASKLFQSGMQAFESGNYKEAITQWEETRKAGIESSGIHHNLGNAYFRTKELGKAIFHYRLASELSPRDPDTQFNLNYARGKAEDKIEDKSLLARLEKMFPLSEKEAYRSLALFSLLLVSLSILLLYKRKPALQWGQRIAFLFFLFSLVIVGEKAFAIKAFGAVSVPEAEVYSGTGADKVLLFRLHDGAEFFVEGTETEGWLQLVLADGKKGWIQKALVVL